MWRIKLLKFIFMGILIFYLHDIDFTGLKGFFFFFYNDSMHRSSLWKIAIGMVCENTQYPAMSMGFGFKKAF